MRSLRSSGRPKKRSRLIVRRSVGKSMLPALRPGTIIVGWTQPKRIRPGDIVILRHEGQEKVKRLHRIGKQGLYVLGDNPGLSTDSRQFGWLEHATLTAKVIWPRRNIS